MRASLVSCNKYTSTAGTTPCGRAQANDNRVKKNNKITCIRSFRTHRELIPTVQDVMNVARKEDITLRVASPNGLFILSSEEREVNVALGMSLEVDQQ